MCCNSMIYAKIHYLQNAFRRKGGGGGEENRFVSLQALHRKKRFSFHRIKSTFVCYLSGHFLCMHIK